jgi:subtilase family serine protease
MNLVRPRTLLSITALAWLVACSDNTVPPTEVTGLSPSVGTGLSMRLAHARVCPSAAPGEARCHSLVRVDNVGEPLATSGPTGYVPADLLAAYALSSSGGAGQTIAVVDAYDDPNAESDLAVYRSQFGLPACTTANGCFRKVDQNGGTSYPRGNTGWGEEISLDLDMASAICPNCKILLVEASSNSFANLATAVDRAAVLGANVISNSYGGSEYSGEVNDESHFNHPGIAITVSSGDGGFGAEFPAASQYVTAVGGTSLRRDGSPRGFTETVWSGAGSGCSAFITKPSWQTDTGCSHRTVADVSAVADPNTGVSVYDTYLHPRGGWLVFGGTSVAAPVIGGVYALAGNASSINYGSFSYSNTSSLFDVLSGSNGSCGGSYLCTGASGYDGPTGNGTPNGTGAF